MGEYKNSDFSVGVASVSARLWRAGPYGTYIPVYGGGGRGGGSLYGSF
jgi:hypothetical protein